MVDPLLRSATARSAFLNTLEPPRSTFGASDGRSDATLEYSARPRLLCWSKCRALVVQRSPKYTRGRKLVAVFRSKSNVGALNVAMMVKQGKPKI